MRPRYADPNEWTTGDLSLQCEVSKPTIRTKVMEGKIPAPAFIRGNRAIWTTEQAQVIKQYFDTCRDETEKRLIVKIFADDPETTRLLVEQDKEIGN